MTRRPIWPFIRRLQFVDKNTATLRTFGDNATFPQHRIIEAIEASMVGGDIATAGGVRTLRANSPTRLIILKARQMGVSTVLEGVGFQYSMCLPNMRGLIVSHDTDSSKHLLSMTRRYWDTSWLSDLNVYQPKNMAGQILGWLEPDTELRVATAKNLASGRSHTLRFLHGSEVAFWQDGKTLMTGLAQSVPRAPRTLIAVESTANGVGNYFEQTWNEAVAGDSNYVPLFYPWWQHPGYQAEHIGLDHLLTNTLSGLDEEERALTRAFKRMGMTATTIKSKLIWRREILATECLGDIDKFHQEYPATPEEAFISTGRNVFPIAHLNAAYEPLEGERGALRWQSGTVRFVKDRQGPLVMFRRPDPAAYYAVGGDAAKQAKGDKAVCQVIDRVTWEQCCVYRDDVDPVTFADQNIMLGHFYNEALLIPETNMSGGAVAEIVRSQYDNVYIHQSAATVRGQMANQYGFNTNTQTKPEAVGNLKRAFYDAHRGQSTILIHDRVTFHELKNYVLTDTGQYSNAGGEAEGADHDDHVMALALAVTGTIHDADELPRTDLPNPSATGRRATKTIIDPVEAAARRVAAQVDAKSTNMATALTKLDDDDDDDDVDDDTPPSTGLSPRQARGWDDRDRDTSLHESWGDTDTNYNDSSEWEAW